MKKTLIYLILGIVSALGSFGTVSASPVTVTAKLDSVQILMGKITMLRLQVVQNQGTKGDFSFLRGAPADGVVGVCGDSVELRTAVQRDTTDLGSGRIQIDYAVPVQAFDSGLYQLPQLDYVAGRDTAYSNAVTLKVIPVAVNADAEISGYADVMGPAESSIFDILPDFVVDYWVLILIILLVIAATIWLVVRYKQKGAILPAKAAPSPYVVALRALENLKTRKLWEQGMEREYFTELTDILRTYLDKRFGINAMEMTTRQIIDKLSSDSRIRDKREYVRQVLDMADFVKFAAMRPLPTDNVKSYENAVKFVEETKPEPEAETKTAKVEDGFEIHDEEKPQKGGGK